MDVVLCISVRLCLRIPSFMIMLMVLTLYGICLYFTYATNHLRSINATRVYDDELLSLNSHSWVVFTVVILHRPR